MLQEHKYMPNFHSINRNN